MKFRKLKKTEIECKVQKVNAGGIVCLLWKNKFATIDILNECVNPMNWKMNTASINGKTACILEIFDSEKNDWISRVGFGEPSDYAKAEWNDAVNATGTIWGIGRELYSAPEIFIPRKELKNYSYDESTKKGEFYDLLRVDDISYQGDVIKDITISIISCKDHKVYLSKTFRNSFPESSAEKNIKTSVTKTVPVEKQLNINVSEPVEQAQIMDDSEKILIGNCRGKTYGEVKDTPTFKSFLTWAKTSTTKYNNVEMAAQLLKFKAMS